MGKPKIEAYKIDLSQIDGEDGVREVREMIAKDAPPEVAEAIGKMMQMAMADMASGGEPFASENDAIAEALRHWSAEPLTSGMLVKLNDRGRVEYPYLAPEGKHFATIVIDVWPHYVESDGGVANGVVACVLGKGVVHTQAVDLRCFSPARNMTKN